MAANGRAELPVRVPIRMDDARRRLLDETCPAGEPAGHLLSLVDAEPYEARTSSSMV
jgi:hypothetical protein